MRFSQKCNCIMLIQKSGKIVCEEERKLSDKDMRNWNWEKSSFFPPSRVSSSTFFISLLLQLLDIICIYIRVVQNWAKFYLLIYLSPLHKCPIKEGFLTSWGVKSNEKPCRQNHRLAMGIFYCHRKPIVLPPWSNI